MARDSQLYINSSQYQKLSRISSIITIFSVLSIKKSASLDIIITSARRIFMVYMKTSNLENMICQR